MPPEDETAELLTTRLLIGELSAHFANLVAHDVVAATVVAAVCDLRGSVQRDDLPQMAARLAQHRLSVIALDCPPLPN